MALKYERVFNNIAIVGDKKIKFTPWTTRNEKDYLIAVEADEKIDDSKLYDLLIKPCLEDPSLTLSTNEQKMLMIEIRKKSLGSTFPMRYICNNCKQVNDIDVNFDQIIKFQAENFHDIEVENMIFKFGPIATDNLKRRLDEQDTNVDYAFTELILHIQSIEIDGRVEDTFTFDELKEFMEDIPSSIFDKVYKEFQDMKSKLDFELKTYCITCNSENEVEFDHIPNFLWT